MQELQRVLLIEDNAIAQRIPKIILESSGCEVDIAENGQQALAAAKTPQSSYDLILLDIGLPDMDGFDVAKQLRQQNGLQQTPIIGLTAHLDLDDHSDCINKTFSKPFTRTMLKKIIERYFNS